MSRQELLDRSRQAMAKRFDAIRYRLGSGFIADESRPAVPEDANFFFGPEMIGTILQILRERLPGEVSRIVSQADKICNHRFDLLGYEDLEYGDPIDWHLDVVHRKRAPRKAFHKIRYLDFEEVGDSKVTWELNRHQHLVTLAKAYRLTSDERYANEIFRQWRHWRQENPYPVGINWASSLEVGFRSVSWCWMYYLLEGTPAMPEGFRREWWQAQALNGRHIERYLSTYFSPNTHLLGEGVALFFLGTLCPESPSSERWMSKGWNIILEESERQVRADGFHFEQSVYYHVYALDFFLHALILARANRFPVQNELESRVEKMLEALTLLGHSGPPPSLGDDDGGRLFDPRRNRAEHLLDPLSTGAVLFQRGDFKAVAGSLREESVWLLGKKGLQAWDDLTGQAVHFESAALPSAGLYFLPGADASVRLMIDAGPQGAGNGGHAHAGALSVTLQSKGNTILDDSGSFEYVGPERDHFRGTAAHNTVVVDGLDQSEPRGPFGWERLTNTETEEWIQGQAFALFSGSHDGYTRLPAPAVHHRTVLALKSGLFLIRDIVRGQGAHRLESFWHPSAGSELIGPNILRFEDGQSLAIVSADGPQCDLQVCEGDWSPVYGEKLRRSVLKIQTVAELPAESISLLVPLAEDETAGAFQKMSWQKSRASVDAYLYATAERECRFFFTDGAGPWTCGTVASDAKLVVCERKNGSNEDDVVFCHGSYVEIDGRAVLTCKRTVEYAELSIQQGERQISCSDADAVQERSSLSAVEEVARTPGNRGQ